jgi:integrase
MGKLNTAKLRTLTEPGVYGDGGGLYLQVRDAEHRSWVYRYTLFGKARWMGLGAFADVSLAEAREAATAARKQVRAGNDPIAARKAEMDAKRSALSLHTFKEVAAAYVAAHEASWRNEKHRQQWRNTLATYADPVLGKMPVAVVDVAAVITVLEPIWREKPETASRLRGRIESVLDFAAARGWRSGDNPARWKGHLDNLLPARSKVAAVEHHAALPWQEIGAFWEDLGKQGGSSALALRLLILTATRTNEALCARWSEIDLSEKVWTIPAERMKAKKEHRVPLSDGALSVLGEAARLRPDNAPADAFLFPGAKAQRPLSNMALLMLLRRMDRDDLTTHGFRSTFRDWAAEATNYPRDVAEQALAHSLPDKVEAAYRRGDLIEKRRLLMRDWATFCARPVGVGDVVPLRTREG